VSRAHRAAAAARRAGAALGRHPRHCGLAAVVAGLAASNLGSLATLAVVTAVAAPAAIARRLAIALLTAGCALAGASLGDHRLGTLGRTSLRPLLGTSLDARATLLEPARERRFGGRSAAVRIRAGPGRGERVVLRVPGRVAWPQAGVGAELAVEGRLVALARYESYERRKGAHVALAVESVRATGRCRGGIAGAVDRIRLRSERALAAGLDDPRAALMRGMVLGDDTALTEVTRDHFRASGLAHVLAASGQNVMLLAALAMAVLAAAGAGLRWRLTGALALIALYVPLAGGGASIQRAGVMGAAGVVAALAGRPSSRAYALLLAGAATLALNPRAVGDPGWQLSFAAVVAILVLTGRVRDWLVRRRVPRGLAEVMAVAGPATVATAPLLAAHFGRASLVSFPVNVLAAPAVAPVVWLGTVSSAVGQAVPGASAVINALALYPLGFVGWLARAGAGVPYASVELGTPSLVVAAGAVTAAGAVAVSRRARGLACAAAVGLAVAVLPVLGAPGRPGPPPSAVIVSFFDVGQGDATLIQHGGRAVLFDTGPPGGPIVARLREAGVSRLDALVLTHAQADHEGAAPAVLEAVRVDAVIDGGGGVRSSERRAIEAALASRRVRRMVPAAGQLLRVGSIRLRILWPEREPAADHAGGDPNTRAVVAHVAIEDFDVVLPADAESEVTGALDLPRAEALKVAHHGSADPGLAELVQRVAPAVAVIEVGAGNPYGHPSPQALRALRGVPSVYRTDRHGTVRVTYSAGEMRIAAGA
jgi:competence protein ComEC